MYITRLWKELTATNAGTLWLCEELSIARITQSRELADRLVLQDLDDGYKAPLKESIRFNCHALPLGVSHIACLVANGDGPLDLEGSAPPCFADRRQRSHWVDDHHLVVRAVESK